MNGSSVKTDFSFNPFVGPNPIETGRKIFGRDREIDDLYYLLSAERIVMLHSPSGAGKTSLIQAGLFPRLNEQFDVWGRARVNKPPQNSPEKVNRYVLSAVLDFEQQIPAERRRNEAQLADLLAGKTLADYVASRPRRRAAPQDVVLFFDQFEEILTADPLAIDTKREFFKQVGELLLDPHVWALFAMREDYLPALDPYAEQVPTHLKNWFRLDLLRREDAAEAIINTAKEGGRNFIDEEFGKSAVVDAFVNDLATVNVQQPDGNFADQVGLYVEPLQLQVVCRQLWYRMPIDKQTIDRADIEKSGDVTEALGDYYAAEVKKLAYGNERTERKLRDWVGKKLITPDGVRSQVLHGVGSSEGLENELIAGLVNTHLVRGEQRENAIWYELAHDRLINPILDNNKVWSDVHLHEVQKLALLWSEQANPSPSLLLVGADLIKAQQWAKQNEISKESIEGQFLAASAAKQEEIEKEQRQAKRLRVMFVTMVIVALLALVLAGTTILAYRRVEVEKNNANRQKEIAEGTAYVANMNLAGAETERGNHRRIFELLDAYLPIISLSQKQEDLRSFYWYYLWRQNYRDIKLGSHTDDFCSVAFSPDGRTLASASRDKLVKLWDVPSRKEVATLNGHIDAIYSVAFSPDGQTLASASEDASVKLWDVQSRKHLATLSGHAASVNSVAYSPDGRTLASGSEDKSVKLWDVGSRKVLAMLSGHMNCVRSVAFSPDGRTLASGSDDGSIKLWDVKRRKELATLSGHTDAVYSVAFSPDGQTLASAGWTPSIELWDIQGRNVVATLRGHTSSVHSVAFSPDGRTLASAGSDETIRLWDVGMRKELTKLRGQTSDFPGDFNSVAFSPDGRTLASGDRWGDHPSIKLWDVGSRKELTTLSDNMGEVFSVAFSPDGRTLACADTFTSVKLWDIQGGNVEATLSGHAPVTFSPDGRTLASQGQNWSVKLWDVGSRKELATFSGHDASVNSLAFSPDGRTLASGSPDETLKLWDVQGRTQLATLRGHTDDVNSVTFSPDGRTLASGSDDGSIKLWDVDSQKEVATLSGHRAPVYSVAFSPDGRTLASASGDASVKLWDVQGRKQLATLSGHTDAVYSLAFSPDGRTLASGSGDKSVKLWDMGSLKELTTLSGYPKFAISVAFSPDGRTLASADWDKSVRLWIGATDKDIEDFRPRK